MSPGCGRYNHQLFDDTKHSAYNLWKNLGPVINPKKTKINESIRKLCCDGNYETDSVSISNFMNNYSCRIGKKYSTTHSSYKKQIFHIFARCSRNWIILSPTSVQEIEGEIKFSNLRKASGSDSIVAKVLKVCPHIFAGNLSKIYNRSIEMGVAQINQSHCSL